MMTTAVTEPVGRSRVRRRPGRPVRIVARAAAAVLAAGLLTVATLWLLTPPVGDLLQRARDVQVAHDEPVALDEPAPRVVAALVATEDSRFFTGHGLDPLGAARGTVGMLAGDPLAGGAGLDQQLAKVLYVPRTDVVGKLEQIVVGLKIDASWSKQDILRAYLGSVYFGHGFWGLDAATHGYFSLAPARVSTGQAALLAGIVQAPSAYDPLHHLDLALRRRAHVFDRMVETGVLTPAQAGAAGAAPLDLRHP